MTGQTESEIKALLRAGEHFESSSPLGRFVLFVRSAPYAQRLEAVSQAGKMSGKYP